MNVFEEIHYHLSNKIRVRSLFKDVHVEDLERIILRMKNVLSEKVESRNKDNEKRKAKLESIAAIKQIMADRGVSVEDLDIFEALAPKRRRNIQKFTFVYQTETGNSIQWDGSTTGRLPRYFQAYLDRTGKKRLDCVIEKK